MLDGQHVGKALTSRYLSHHGKTDVVTQEQVIGSTFPPVHRHVSIENCPTHIERTVQDWYDLFSPSTIGQLGLRSLIIPLVLRAQSKQTTSLCFSRGREQPFNLLDCLFCTPRDGELV